MQLRELFYAIPLYLNNHDIQLFCHNKPKNGIKMNKIVQEWQFQKTFYTAIETVSGVSQNRLAELFQNYVFSTKEYLYFDLYVGECQIKKIWPMSRLGVYV